MAWPRTDLPRTDRMERGVAYYLNLPSDVASALIERAYLVRIERDPVCFVIVDATTGREYRLSRETLARTTARLVRWNPYGYTEPLQPKWMGVVPRG